VTHVARVLALAVLLAGAAGCAPACELARKTAPVLEVGPPQLVIVRRFVAFAESFCPKTERSTARTVGAQR